MPFPKVSQLFRILRTLQNIEYIEYLCRMTYNKSQVKGPQPIYAMRCYNGSGQCAQVKGPSLFCQTPWVIYSVRYKGSGPVPKSRALSMSCETPLFINSVSCDKGSCAQVKGPQPVLSNTMGYLFIVL